MTNDEMISEHCGGCARFFERDPSGIQTITTYWDQCEQATEFIAGDKTSREYRCNWLTPIDKIHDCPCSQCLIKTVCWDQCEQAIEFMQAEPILFLDNAKKEACIVAPESEQTSAAVRRLREDMLLLKEKFKRYIPYIY